MAFSEWFSRFARETARGAGHPWTVAVACAIVINTGTTIVTFLMVFLIQNTQNRDAKAVHLKLDELIRALGPARNKLVDLEKLSDDELKKLEQEFERLRKQAEGVKEDVEELKSAASH